MVMEHVQHRAGNLKQSNKAHKHGRHRSKGSMEKLYKGRTVVNKLSVKKKDELRREERRNQARQLRDKKRMDYLNKKRDMTEAPFLVVVIPLQSSIDTEKVIGALKQCDDDVELKDPSHEKHHNVYVPKLKTKFTLIPSNIDNLYDTLDMLKVADVALFLTSIKGIDEDASLTLTAALAQGLPSSVAVCTDLDSIHLKKRQDAKTSIEKELDRWLPGEKVFGLEKPGDSLMLFRRMSNLKQKKVYYRDNRPHLIAESVSFVENQVGKGTLKVTGYLRGHALDVNSLVHIPGWGDFQMAQIDLLSDPFSIIEELPRVLEVASAAKQWSLDSENVPDPMDAEQTWPTEEEIAAAEQERKMKKVKQRPPGWSDYQAAWIPDNDAIELSEEEVDDEEEMNDAKSEEQSEEEMETGTEMSEAGEDNDKYDEEMDQEEEMTTLKKLKEAQEDKEFPDEVDTPRDVPARQRFAKYRGLASFRTSPWNPKENLPSEYARIFQFQNFDRTRKQILKEQMDCGGALPGWYITVHIKDVPMYLYQFRGPQPITVFGLLEHEQKMSVVNMVLKRPAVISSSEPIKSKETLLFHVGYRRYRAQPIFSQHTKGSKFKYERFFHPEETVMATVFAPIIFPPSPVLVFKECSDGSSVFMAMGRVHSVNPNRIIVKRAVLSGHPFKVNKRSAVIRFMFYNREDIAWFKPVELHTKYGRRGHVKEPLGTHGHMKCVFNGQLKSQDTVLLNLYKRVFPKWTYDPQVTFTRVVEEEENKM